MSFAKNEREIDDDDDDDDLGRNGAYNWAFHSESVSMRKQTQVAIMA